MSGVVLDSAGAPVVGAFVYFTNQDLGQAPGGTTDGFGYYSARAYPGGNYTGILINSSNSGTNSCDNPLHAQFTGNAVVSAGDPVDMQLPGRLIDVTVQVADQQDIPLAGHCVSDSASGMRSGPNGSLLRASDARTDQDGMAHLQTYSGGYLSLDTRSTLPDGTVLAGRSKLLDATSDITTRVVITFDPQPPAPPTSAHADPPSAGSVVVSWTAPSSDGGRPIAMYTVTADPGGASCATEGETSCVVSGLHKGTEYAFSVTATNSVGTSPPSSAVKPMGLPGAPSGVTASAGDKTITVTWSPPDEDGGRSISGYTVTAETQGFTCQTTGELSCTFDGLSDSGPWISNGTRYSFTVRATNAVGSGPASTPSNVVTPAGLPFPPFDNWATPGDASALVEWSAGGSNGSPITGYQVVSVPEGGTCTTNGALSCIVTGLTNGITYQFAVSAVNALGVGRSSPYGVPATPVAPDRTPPVVSVATLPVFNTANGTTFSFSASDVGTGVASYDVRYRRAVFNAGFGALTYPAGWQQMTARSVSLANTRGSTTCFSIRARDRGGNVSAWSTERCTASPLDDRSLTASTGWTRGSAGAYYAGTVTSVSRLGAVLTRTSVQARRLSLVATRCPGCGTVGVYWNGTLVRRIGLNSSAIAHRQLFTIADFGAVRAGTVTIKTLNTGRTYIDGLAASRS